MHTKVFCHEYQVKKKRKKRANAKLTKPMSDKCLIDAPNGHGYLNNATDVECLKDGIVVTAGTLSSPSPKVSSKVENVAKIQKTGCVLEETDGSNKCKIGCGKMKKRHKRQMPLEEETEVRDGIYQISSGDEDCSRGMKKWLTEYRQRRPGLKVLQQNIDEYLIACEAQEELVRKEREAQAAEGGWTVVVHHKGRKKTTDAESGVTVGSVSQASVVDKLAIKKNKVALDFYKFQKREAQQKEVIKLQSKFEEDKRRIQQLRATRKFKPC